MLNSKDSPFNADVAHELCTPLSNLISNTELALRKARGADELREVLGSNLEELQRVAGVVQDMLFLSQADRGSSACRVATASLAAVALQVADYHDAALDDAGLQMEVIGDKVRLTVVDHCAAFSNRHHLGMALLRAPGVAAGTSAMGSSPS